MAQTNGGKQSGEYVECPLCGDFVGSVKSVQQHITRKIDDAHDGEDGSDHVAEMVQQQAEEPDPVDNPFEETGSELEGGEVDSTGIEHAKKEETDDGQTAVTVTAVGVTALFLWWLAGGSSTLADNQQPNTKPPGAV